MQQPESLPMIDPGSPSPPSSHSRWLLLILMVVFSPGALYLMWKDASYRQWLVALQLLAGGEQLLLLIGSLLTFQQLRSLSDAMGAPDGSVLALAL